MGQCASQRDGGNSKKETESSLGSKRIGSSSNGSGNPDTHSTKDIDIVYSLPGLGTYNDKNEDINLVKWDIVLPNSAFKEPGSRSLLRRNIYAHGFSRNVCHSKGC
jgi:hypothetical protein